MMYIEALWKTSLNMQSKKKNKKIKKRNIKLYRKGLY